MKLVVVGLLAVVVVAACGESRKEGTTPSGRRASCSADAECAVATKSGCCAICPEAPHAIPLLASEQQKNRCADAGCPAASERIECPHVDGPEGYAARCIEGTCRAVKAAR